MIQLSLFYIVLIFYGFNCFYINAAVLKLFRSTRIAVFSGQKWTEWHNPQDHVTLELCRGLLRHPRGSSHCGESKQLNHNHYHFCDHIVDRFEGTVKAQGSPPPVAAFVESKQAAVPLHNDTILEIALLPLNPSLKKAEVMTLRLGDHNTPVWETIKFQNCIGVSFWNHLQDPLLG